MDNNKLEEVIDSLINKYIKVKKERDFYKSQYFEMKENVENLLEKLSKLEPLIIRTNDNRGENG